MSANSPEREEVMVVADEASEKTEKTEKETEWEMFSERLLLQARSQVETRLGRETSNPLFYYLMGDKEDLSYIEEGKQEELAQAFEMADWQAPIFLEEGLQWIALNCFKSHRITYQQLITLLERQQQQLDFNTITTHTLLDKNGDYTDYATETFLPLLEESLRKQGVILDRERLRFLMQGLPQSEQIAYSSSINQKVLYQGGILPGTTIGEKVSDSLLGKMQILGVIIIDFRGFEFAQSDDAQSNNTQENDTQSDDSNELKLSLISMSSGVADAVAITCYGLTRYVNPIFRRGEINVRNIEDGIRNECRPTTMALTEDPTPKFIHEYLDPGRVATTAHDRYHSGIMSRMSREHRAAFVYMIDIARVDLDSMHEAENKSRRRQMKKSEKTLVTKETWIATDAAFPIKPGVTFFSMPKDIEKSTEEFCQNLSSITNSSKGTWLDDNYSGFFV